MKEVVIFGHTFGQGMAVGFFQKMLVSGNEWFLNGIY
jgi:hypothetical protein